MSTVSSFQTLYLHTPTIIARLLTAPNQGLKVAPVGPRNARCFNISARPVVITLLKAICKRRLGEYALTVWC